MGIWYLKLYLGISNLGIWLSGSRGFLGLLFVEGAGGEGVTGCSWVSWARGAGLRERKRKHRERDSDERKRRERKRLSFVFCFFKG